MSSTTSTGSLPSASQPPTPIDTGIGSIVLGVIGGVSLLGLILIIVSVKFRRPYEETQRYPMDRANDTQRHSMDKRGEIEGGERNGDGVGGNTNNAMDGQDSGDSSTLAPHKVDGEAVSIGGKTAVDSESSSYKGRGYEA